MTTREHIEHLVRLSNGRLSLGQCTTSIHVGSQYPYCTMPDSSAALVPISRQLKPPYNGPIVTGKAAGYVQRATNTITRLSARLKELA